MLLGLIFSFVLFFGQAALAYYEVDETSRPPSAFSLCCCKKETEDTSQSVYSCKYEEMAECPPRTRQYKVAALGCPSDLVLTKYHPEENRTKD